MHATKGGDSSSGQEKTSGAANLSGEMARVVSSRNVAGQHLTHIICTEIVHATLQVPCYPALLHGPIAGVLYGRTWRASLPNSLAYASSQYAHPCGRAAAQDLEQWWEHNRSTEWFRSHTWLSTLPEPWDSSIGSLLHAYAGLEGLNGLGSVKDGVSSFIPIYKLYNKIMHGHV